MGILSDVLSSVGSYMVAQAKMGDEFNLEMAKEQIVANRELALKMVDAQIADKARDADQTNSLARIDRTAEDQQKTDLVEGVVGTRKELAVAGAKQTYDQQNIILKGNIDAKLEKLRQNGTLTEEQYRQALSDKSEFQKEGRTIGHSVVSPIGEVAYYNQHGDLLSQTKPGTTAPPKIDDGSDSGIPGLGGGSTGETAATLYTRNKTTSGGGIGPSGSSYASKSGNPGSYNPADTAPPAANDAVAKAAFGVRYNGATPQTAPNLFRNGHKIPIEEAWQMYSGH